MEVHHSTAEFDIQFIASNDKLDDIGTVAFVCNCLPVKWLAHITPIGE
jgi:hypothetical protein